MCIRDRFQGVPAVAGSACDATKVSMIGVAYTNDSTLEVTVDTDMDTFATALYVKIDDELATNPSLRIWRPEVGIAPKLSDAELLTMAVLQALLGFTSETRFLRYARKHLGGYFPYLPHQSGYNKRLRRAQAQLNALIRELGQDTDLWDDDTWVIDSTPVECGRSRPTARRSDLAGFAGYGYCASHTRYFWGLRLHLVCTPAGLPVAFALANPKIDEREVARDLFEIDPDLLSHRPGHLPLVDLGIGQCEGNRKASWRTDQVQSQSPEVAGVAGAVSIAGEPGEITSSGRRTGASALHRRGVDHPGVVIPEVGVLTKLPDQGVELSLGPSQPLVIAGLMGQVGEVATQMLAGVAEEPGLRGEAEQRLEHRHGQQLGITQLGGDTHLGPPDPKRRIGRQFIVDLHVQCGSEGVHIGVHGDLLGRIVGVSNADHGRLRRVTRGPSYSGDPLESVI